MAVTGGCGEKDMESKNNSERLVRTEPQRVRREWEEVHAEDSFRKPSLKEGGGAEACRKTSWFWSSAL